MSRSWAGGSTTAWRRLRAYVLARDGYICQVRMDCCTHHADQVDHIIPRSAGGEDTEQNCRAACRACNLARRTAAAQYEPEPRRVSSW